MWRYIHADPPEKREAKKNCYDRRNLKTQRTATQAYELQFSRYLFFFIFQAREKKSVKRVKRRQVQHGHTLIYSSSWFFTNNS